MVMGKLDYPEKLYYRIGEVSRITGVKPHVLRYWEQEFNLHPKKPGRPQRRYEKRDVEAVLLIKKLLYEDRYTIAGAKKRLQGLSRQERRQLEMEFTQASYDEILHDVVKELKDIKEVLD